MRKEHTQMDINQCKVGMWVKVAYEGEVVYWKGVRKTKPFSRGSMFGTSFWYQTPSRYGKRFSAL